LLMGPGPSCVPPEVYDALRRKTLGHLDPYFLKIMDELKEMLRALMNTQNELTIPISGTGSAGMEAAFVNLVEPGDKVLVLINGVFGVRMREVATRLGAAVDALEFTWGTPVNPEEVDKQLKTKTYDIVAVVHAETSTGVLNPVAEIGALLRGKETIYLVDTVTSLGGTEVRMDDWGIDALYSGTQKCLSCPPGLAPLSFSAKAMAKLRGRKNKVPNWYLDISLIANYWGKDRVYHHTAPINMIYALYQALYLIQQEGLPTVFNRHRETHLHLVAGLEDFGLEMLVAAPYRLPMLNTVRCPEGVDELAVRRHLRSDYKIEIGGGLGPLAGKIWRIGLMGHTARKENVDRLLTALRTLIG
ncbi:MAG: alanine--glyoxylate aminotransferase family protein, partial [Syntrophales bacterium]|nr:alanine--glyoxylate aminotransferase family protein [Syntrophales bacterium]